MVKLIFSYTLSMSWINKWAQCNNGSMWTAIGGHIDIYRNSENCLIMMSSERYQKVVFTLMQTVTTLVIRHSTIRAAIHTLINSGQLGPARVNQGLDIQDLFRFQWHLSVIINYRCFGKFIAKMLHFFEDMICSVWSQSVKCLRFPLLIGLCSV